MHGKLYEVKLLVGELGNKVLVYRFEVMIVNSDEQEVFEGGVNRVAEVISVSELQGCAKSFGNMLEVYSVNKWVVDVRCLFRSDERSIG